MWVVQWTVPQFFLCVVAAIGEVSLYKFFSPLPHLKPQLSTIIAPNIKWRSGDQFLFYKLSAWSKNLGWLENTEHCMFESDWCVISTTEAFFCTVALHTIWVFLICRSTLMVSRMCLKCVGSMSWGCSAPAPLEHLVPQLPATLVPISPSRDPGQSMVCLKFMWSFWEKWVLVLLKVCINFFTYTTTFFTNVVTCHVWCSAFTTKTLCQYSIYVPME